MVFFDLSAISKKITQYSGIISIDYGGKKTGICIKDINTNFFVLFVNKTDDHLLSFINSLIYKRNISLVIIGFPKNLQNKSHVLQNDIINFSQKIIGNFDIFFADERFSTQYGINIKNNFFFHKKPLLKIKNKIINQLYKKEDAFAAQFMMEYVLDYLTNYRDFVINYN